MITIHKSGKITIPHEEGFIGYAGDNLNKTLEFIVENQTDRSLYYRIFLQFDDDTVNYFLLSRKFVGNDTVLLWNVTQGHLYKDGIVYMQIKAFGADGEVFHTESVPIFVGKSIEFCNYLAERPVSEYVEHEQQLNQLIYDVEEAKQFLPYIGNNGNWYVYDYEVKAYSDSGMSALGSAEKYPLTTELTSDSTDENASSAKAVYTYGQQILSDSKEYFSTNAGELEYLNTEDKSNLVNAINEIDNKKISNTTASVTTNNLDNEAVTSEKIAESAVTENKIANETVTNNKLAKNSVTTDKIKMGSVTGAKLASDAVSENVLNNDLKTKINSKLNAPTKDGNPGQVLMTSGGGNASVFWGTVSGDSGGTGTSNYLELDNKPTINGVELSGNINTEELGIKDGENGKDGTSVTVQNISESTADGGSNIVTFSDGKTLTVKNGSKGSTGDKGDTGSAGKDGVDGYTPIKGTDYWTYEDKSEIIAEAKAELSQLEPNFANSIEECTDTSKVYVLPDGYIYAYMNVSGYSDKDIMPVSETEQTKNGLTFTTDGNGSYILNGTATASAVYKIYESNTSLPEDFEIGKKYKLILKSGYIGTTAIMIDYGNGFESFTSIINNANYVEFTIPDNAVGMQIKFYPATNYEYTDEVVRYECYRYIDGYAYANTGHAFVPADYEDRIIALEKEVQPKATTSKPMLTIIDDDGYKKFTTLLLPIIQEKGVPISTAVVVGRANGEDEESVTEKVMNWEEIENAYLAGAEILSHTYWHLSQAKVETMTNTQIQYDYQRAQNTLRSHGIKSDGLVFAGASCNLEKCQTACANVYQYAFKSYGDVINKKGNVKPYQIDRYKIEPTGLLNETDLKSLIDTLVSDGTGWMVWMIHTSDSGFQQEQANVISTVIDYAIEQGVEIVTAECGARNYV